MIDFNFYNFYDKNKNKNSSEKHTQCIKYFEITLHSIYSYKN